MTLLQTLRTGSIALFALLAFGSIILGNVGYAEAAIRPDFGGHIVCNIVFPDVNENGDPIPHLDPSCEQPPPPAPQCANGTDDDSDGFVDTNDPNCHTDGNPKNASSYDPNRSEAGTLPACWNGADDDGDGKTDFPADPGCSSATDNDETDPSGGGNGPAPACSNGTDDDGDGLVDLADPGCTDANDNDESNSTGGGGGSQPQCSDGADNDGDGKIDSADPNCHTDGDAANVSTYDPNRTEDAPLPACGDGTDNDGDGKTDFPNDPGCSTRVDVDEADPTPSSGGSSGGSGGSGSAIATQVGPAAVLGTTTPPYVAPGESCDQYLTAFIRSGRQNDSEQVRRLQYVLRGFENASIEMTGVYDAATLAAVHAFQEKYSADILAPWGIGGSTGYVYLTTRKKINEIYCRGTNQFPLTPEQLQIIERARTNSSQTLAPTSAGQTETGSAQNAGTQEDSQSGEEGGSWWERLLEVLRPAPAE